MFLGMDVLGYGPVPGRIALAVWRPATRGIDAMEKRTNFTFGVLFAVDSQHARVAWSIALALAATTANLWVTRKEVWYSVATGPGVH